MMLRIGLVLALATMCAPAEAEVVKFLWTGSVNTVEGNAPGNEIKIGDAIRVSYAFDTATAGTGVTFPSPGGGSRTNYGVSLQNYRFSIGSYVVMTNLQPATLSYTDNMFGQDLLGFLTNHAGPGPFASTFALPQLIAQGPDDIIASPSISQGFPYAAFPTKRLFIAFGNGATSKRIFGDLTVDVTAVPEPSAWLLFITAFGVGGLCARKRHTLAA